MAKKVLAVAIAVVLISTLTIALANSDSLFEAYKVLTKITLNGAELKYDCPVVMINDNVYVPLRETAEQLGMSVEWNEENNDIVIAEKSTEIIEKVKEELKREGWNNINVISGIVDYSYWTSAVIEDTEEEKSSDVSSFTVLGEYDGLYDNPIVAVVKIAFSKESPEGRVYKIFYASEAGRYLESYKILSTNDDLLIGTMYSY